MTREEILAMEPGREFDMLVFKFVMGGRIPKPPYIANFTKFSTDISAAWEVVEKMRPTHRFELRVGKDKQSAGFDLYGFRNPFDDRPEWYAQCDTAPEAICKAALLAITEVQA